VAARAEARHYAEPGAMLADARQVFRNCELYNPPGSDIRFLAQGLEVRGGPAQGPERCRRRAMHPSVSALEWHARGLRWCGTASA